MKANALPGLPTLIIGVMGVTGSGKSSFVETASGRNDVGVGHGLEAHTSVVRAYEFHTDKYNIVLVDTPGFDDTHKSDTEILLELAKWLEITYRQNCKLTGIVYLHRIMDVRMGGSAMRNLKMFRKLCGDDPLSNVVIASTFWGVLPHDTSVAKEQELCDSPHFWGDMIKHGAQVTRYTGTQESAIEVLMSFAKKRPITLEIQRELVDEHIPLKATAAGYAVNEELAEQEKKHKDELAKLQDEIKQALLDRDIEIEEVLRKEAEKTEQRVNRIRSDQEKWRQQRGEEVRKLEMENEKRFKQMKMEHDRVRAADKATFRDEMARLQADNEILMKRAASDRNVGEKLAQFAINGVSALVEPAAIPLAIGGLVELINEILKD